MSDNLPIWHGKDRDWTIPEMETRHIKNALASLKRRGYVGPSTISFYVSGPMPTGDGAMDAFDMEFDAMMDRPVSKFVDLFEEELKQREITQKIRLAELKKEFPMMKFEEEL